MKRWILISAFIAACGSARSSNDGGSPLDSGPTDAGSNDAGFSDAGMIPIPTVASLSPTSGAAGDGFTITGTDFAQGAEVFFGQTLAVNVSANTAGTQLVGTVPTQPADTSAQVSVVVQNAPGVSVTLADAFTYGTATLANWCRIDPPTSVQILAGQTTPTLQGEVYQPGITPGTVGVANGVSGQVGYGLATADPGSWSWTNASYTSNSGNNDVFTGTLSPSALGGYAFAFRFSIDGGQTFVYCDSVGLTEGFQVANAGTLTVLSASSPTVTGFSPSFLPIAGGTLTITGAALDSSATVTIGGQAASVTSSSATQIVVTAPAMTTPGPQSVVVADQGSTLTAPAMLEYVLKFTITVDGDLSDWPSAALLGTENPSNSSWGLTNTLSSLYLGYDATNFYIGIEGGAEAQNAIIGYLSISGLTWGSSDIATTLTEHNPSNDSLGDELSSVFDVADATFLAHYGYGLFGAAGSLANTVGSGIGVRQLMNRTNFGWSNATVASTSTAVEIAIPWQTNGTGADLFVPFPSGAANPMTIRTFVRIVSDAGTMFATQGLPDDPNLQQSVTNATTQETVSTVAAIEIR